ncbi:hypothetical protein [Nitrincola lacisaponensis]|uniref:hypothetical protein n=1 Tax=Nitrincola lacisaponensis TaxID=267850 RepID=UPI0005629CB3|nr:hypothetical protein [Nitrincola lacisaponensis]
MSPNLPYRLPNDTKEQIYFLRDLLKLPHYIFDAYENQPAISDEKAIEILTGVILYHHLDRHQKHEVMKLLHSELSNRPAIGFLITKITDPMANTYWGLWAKPTTELLEDLELREVISSALGLAGAGVTVKTLKDVRDALTKRRPYRRGHPAFLVLIYGFYYNNEGAKNAIQEELNRRARNH